MAQAWHLSARRPFYVASEARAALAVCARAYAPTLRLLGWTSRPLKLYRAGALAQVRTVWIPPGGVVSRRRGRPRKHLIASPDSKN
jgi:hypothetical protein